MNLDAMVRGYMVCALWSSVDDNGRELDARFSVDDIHSATRATMRAECRAFVRTCGPLIERALACDYSAERLGHDFWLTRNGHGAGFWDRDELGKELGEALSEHARKAGEVDLYAERGKVYQDRARADHVVFRWWRKSGGVIALFPHVEWSRGLCASFEHVGQHGGADYAGIIRESRPATEEEYAALREELEREPYTYILDIRSKK